jgi:tRNA A-37 threonylcarbamoyl transferase component Bud32
VAGVQLVNAATPVEGSRIGKYQIVRRLSEDESAEVFLARDPFIDREVALKLTPAEGQNDPDFSAAQRRRFFAEAQIAGALRHPNITTIFDAGIDQDRCYIAMEHVPGGRVLDDYATSGHLLPLDVATRTLSQIAIALDFAHRQGAVHRQLTGANVLLGENLQVKITNFGVAGAPQESNGAPQEHHTASDFGLAQQSDMLALGMLAYRLFTGRIPFPTAPDATTFLTRTPRLSEMRSDAPDILQRIMDKAFARNPAQRYKTGADFAGDLELVFDFLDEQTRWISPQEKLGKVSNLDFFKGFPEADLWELIHAGDWVEVDAGQTILTEEADDLCLYVIVEGTVQVEKRQRQIVRLLAGDCFGEMGLMEGRKRGTRINAESAVTALRIGNAVIERLPASTQNRFQRNFLLALINRLESVSDTLAMDENRHE